IARPDVDLEQLFSSRVEQREAARAGRHHRAQLGGLGRREPVRRRHARGPARPRICLFRRPLFGRNGRRQSPGSILGVLSLLRSLWRMRSRIALATSCALFAIGCAAAKPVAVPALKLEPAPANVTRRRACELGEAALCYQRGMALAGRDGDPDMTAAATWFERSCRDGFAEACDRLAAQYAQGFGVARDDRRAARLFKQACDGGDFSACSSLGVLYGEGRGVEQDEARAATLYRVACQRHDTLGCFNLGMSYLEAHGVELDEMLAAELFQEACR